MIKLHAIVEKMKVKRYPGMLLFYLSSAECDIIVHKCRNMEPQHCKIVHNDYGKVKISLKLYIYTSFHYIGLGITAYYYLEERFYFSLLG